MKHLALPLACLAMFFMVIGTGASVSRRTLTTRVVREHWRVVPYTGYQGMTKKNPVTHVTTPRGN